jgi:hypothetical protein
MTRMGSETRTTAWIVMLAIALPGSLFALYADIGLNLQDGGFLWYGVVQTAAGEVPLRDFQSYEPGRYYWCAAGSLLFGDGILGVRASLAVFQAASLLCGLLAARRATSNPLALGLMAVVLSIWMFSRHKAFDSGLAMMAVYVAVRLIETPTTRQHFVTGIYVGLAGFFGRNHGIYSALAFLVLIPLIAWKTSADPWLRRLAVWGAGILVGLSPLLLMMAFVPGFAAALVDNLLFYSRIGSNLPLPAPWPWRIDYTPLGWFDRIRAFSTGFSFMMLPLIYGIGFAAAILSSRARFKQSRLVIASTVVGLFYSYHVVVRSDLEHLGQCIQPMVLGCFALHTVWFVRPPVVVKSLTWSLLGLVALLVIPGTGGPMAMHWKGEALAEVTAGNEVIRLRPDEAAYLASLKSVIQRHVPDEEALVILPVFPGLYAVLGRQSPIHGTYFLWKADREEEERIVRRLDTKPVNWVFFIDYAIDGRSDVHFRNSHAGVWRHLLGHFEPVPDSELLHRHHLLRRRSG